MPRNEWHIKDADDETKRQIKVYAAANGLPIAQALKQIVAGYFSQRSAADDRKRSKQSGTNRSDTAAAKQLDSLSNHGH